MLRNAKYCYSADKVDDILAERLDMTAEDLIRALLLMSDYARKNGDNESASKFYAARNLIDD